MYILLFFLFFFFFQAEDGIRDLTVTGVQTCALPISLVGILKHFPGHGSTLGDSHKGFVEVPATANREAELAPYRALIAERLVDAVMTAHVVDPALDPEFPATLSRAALTGLLRGELGFDGPVVTDDLRMGAIEQRWGLATAAVTALAAGAGVLLHANARPDGRCAAPGTALLPARVP